MAYDRGGGRELLQVSDVTFPLDSIGNSNTIVDTMLAASMENSDKSVGGAPKSVGAPVEDTTAATEDTAAADFVRHLVKPFGRWEDRQLLGFYKLYDPTHHPHLQDVTHCMLCHTNISTKG